MTFSIIIPVYNVENYLRECLESAVNQTFNGTYEVICVNDGSGDSSLVILEEYAEKYSHIKIINQENKGPSAARNAGIEASKYDYLFFLDSDDWIDKETLSILSKNITDEDMLCFNGKRHFESGYGEEPDKVITDGTLTGWEYYNKYALKSRKTHFVCVWLRIYKREFILKNNLFFEHGIYHEDNLFTPIACYYAKKIKVIPYTLYVYRIRAESITQTINPKRIFDIIRVANNLAKFFISKTDIDKTVVYREIAGEYFSVFMSPKAEMYEKDYSKIKHLIDWNNLKKVSLYPRHKRIYKLLKIHPKIFRFYVKIETILRKIL